MTAATPTTNSIGASRRLQKTNRRLRFNQRILTWLAVAIFIFLYLPIFILIIYSGLH